MTFLTPLLLVLAAGAAVPLLLHLLRRRIGKRVEFPAARYLARAEKENSRQLRIRNLLLMVLRVVAILLLALAASGPIGKVVGVGHAPTAIAIVVDNSLSSSVIVDGRPFLHQLRDAGLEIANRATASDRLWLVTADGETVSGSIAVVRAALERIEPAPGSGDMSLAAARAAALVDAAQPSEKRIALLTDGQQFEWRNVEQLATGEGKVAVYLPVVALPANRSVASVEARPTRWTPLGEIAARLASEDSATYRIDLAGKAFARGSAAPGEEVVVRGSPPHRGWVAGVVEIQPDEMRADDIRHFALWIGAAPTVRVLPSAGTFVVNAVDALVDANRLQRGNNISIAAAEEAASLPALIFAPSDPVRQGAANRELERLGVPWRFAAVTRGDAAVRPTAGSSWADEGVNVRLRYKLELRAGAETDTLARVNGEPWLVAGPGYVLFGSPAEPDAGNLVVRASFIPLLAELITQKLAGEGGAAIAAFPGATIPRPLWTDAMRDSDSASTPLDGSTMVAPRRAGVYQLSRAGRETGALVVNPPAGEFDLRRISSTELRAKFSADDVNVTSDPARFTRDVFESAGRRPLVLPFLIVALCALVLESVVSRDTGAGRPT